MKKAIFLCLTLILLAGGALAANTTTQSGRFITITGLDADWYLDNDLATMADDGLRIVSIKFVPSAVNDILYIRDSKDGTATTGTSCYLKSIDGEPRKDTFSGDPMWPFIDILDCTITTPANAIVIFELKAK